MALIKCSECGQMVSDKAKACPHCGNPIKGVEQPQTEQQAQETTTNQPQKKKSKKWLYVILAILFIAIACFGIWLYFSDDYKAEDVRDYFVERFSSDNDGIEGNTSSQVVAEDKIAEEENKRIEEERRKEEEKKQMEEEAERKQKTKLSIVGTYKFTVHAPNMDKVVTSYSYSKGFTRESRQVGTIDGVEYMIVHPDMRVSILLPGDGKKYVGDVIEVVDGAFSVKGPNNDGKFGRGYILYKSGQRIGTAGNSYGGYDTFVVDTKEHRVYESVSKWRGRDIADTEYLMYDSYTTTIMTSNQTKWEYNYYDEYKSKYTD